MTIVSLRMPRACCGVVCFICGKLALIKIVRVTIHVFFWKDKTGLSDVFYAEDDVNIRAKDVFRLVFQA